MSGKTKAYIRLGVLAVVVLYVVTFLVINSRQTARVWLIWGLEIHASVLWLIVITVALTLVSGWLIKQIRRSLRQSQQ